jgi:hypothetical protein
MGEIARKQKQMKTVESLRYKIGKAQNELRNEAGEYRKPTKREKIALLWEKLRKEALKLAFAVVVAECLIVIALHYGLKWGLYELFQPKSKTIILIRPAEAKEIKQEDPTESKPEEKSVNELLNIIHKHESGNGTARQGLNRTCESKGMSNEYGYNPPNCYKDNATVENIVIDWIKRHKAEGLSDEELLGHYSNGAYTK